MSPEICVIDIASALGGDPCARQSVAKKLSAACEKIGFLIIEGHNLPRALIDRTFTETRAFFDLPRSEKDRFQPTIPGIQRGYQAFESRNLASTVGATAPNETLASLQILSLSIVIKTAAETIAISISLLGVKRM